MGYRSLALKYRPGKFSEVVGQQVPVRVLTNIVKGQKNFPNLLFYGSAGSGKTSLARIFAKALNCESFDGDVCGVCESCKSISSGSSLAYIEQDAASHGNVDDVRELLKVLHYEVPGVKYRVVTLDEAHMMSKEAWNAMLKVIEEPPSHVVFIFVTTEQRKVPETIFSRCYGLPFKRISVDEIIGRLVEVAEKEEVKVLVPVLEAIARRSDGRLRDAVTLLEQLSVLSAGEEIDKETLAMVGVCGQDVYAKFYDLTMTGKFEDTVTLFRHWLSALGPMDFLRGYEDYLHKLFLHSNGFKNQVALPSTKVAWNDLMECIGKVWEMQDMTRSHYSQPRIEGMLARMCLKFGSACSAGLVETNPPPLQVPDLAHSHSSSNGKTNGNGHQKPLPPINDLKDFQKLWQGQ